MERSADPAGCCAGFNAEFDGRTAARDLATYERDGPRPTTRLLRDALASVGLTGATLLDIGGGVGVLQHELAPHVARIVAVDASPSYLEAARDEATRRGYAHRAAYRLGDFADVAPELPEADVVTLDRVICCYRDMPRLVRPAAGRSRRLVGLVLPESNLASRLMQALQNGLRRLTGNPFRGYIHDTREMEAVLSAAGFRSRFRERKGVWRVEVWERDGPGPAKVSTAGPMLAA